MPCVEQVDLSGSLVLPRRGPSATNCPVSYPCAGWKPCAYPCRIAASAQRAVSCKHHRLGKTCRQESKHLTTAGTCPKKCIGRENVVQQVMGNTAHGCQYSVKFTVKAASTSASMNRTHWKCVLISPRWHNALPQAEAYSRSAWHTQQQGHAVSRTKLEASSSHIRLGKRRGHRASQPDNETC